MKVVSRIFKFSIRLPGLAALKAWPFSRVQLLQKVPKQRIWMKEANFTSVLIGRPCKQACPQRQVPAIAQFEKMAKMRRREGNMPIIFRIPISSFPRVRLGLNFKKNYTPHPSETSIVFFIHWYGIFECAFVRAGMQRLSPVSIAVQNIYPIEIIKTFTLCYRWAFCLPSNRFDLWMIPGISAKLW